MVKLADRSVTGEPSCGAAVQMEGSQLPVCLQQFVHLFVSLSFVQSCCRSFPVFLKALMEKWHICTNQSVSHSAASSSLFFLCISLTIHLPPPPPCLIDHKSPYLSILSVEKINI